MKEWIPLNKPYKNYTNKEKMNKYFIENNPQFADLYSFSLVVTNYSKWRESFNRMSEQNKHAYNIAVGNANKAATITDTFVNSGLNKIGIQFETEGGGRYLIGDITLTGNDDGCCSSTAIADDTIITRYRVVFDPNED